MIQTQDQYRRTFQALIETGNLIVKEESYRVDLQKLDYLASLKRHAEKLAAMIDAW